MFSVLSIVEKFDLHTFSALFYINENHLHLPGFRVLFPTSPEAFSVKLLTKGTALQKLSQSSINIQ